MTTASSISVERMITVHASQAHCFDVFVNQMGTWWDLNDKILGEPPGQTAIMEPRVGGRWFERDKNGVECDWGRVLAFEPNDRFVLDWQISADFEYDPNVHCEVEVRFIPESPKITRVELVHRGLEQFGEKAEALRTGLGGEGGWGGLLDGFANAAQARA